MQRVVVSLLAAVAVLACGGLPASDPGVATEAPLPPGTKVVTVLYFDNNTNDASWDVVGKGLADMMVSDLSGVDGLKVVERARLQALVDELQLQGSEFFDPATAGKLGKGLGATHALTGSITAFAPQVRIDIRLVDVATAEVAMADKVSGPADDFFALQQQLSEKLVTALDRKRSADALRTKVPDATVLLEYSQGLDSADRGDLEAASKLLGSVVTRAPEFGLAQDRYGDVMKRLREARERRQGMLSAGQQALLANADVALQGDATKVSGKKAEERFAYRIVRGELFLTGAGALLEDSDSQFEIRKVIPAADQAAAKELMGLYVQNTVQLVNELRAYRAARGELPSFPGLPDADDERARALKIRTLGLRANQEQAVADLASTVVLGRYGDAALGSVPTPAELDPALVPPVLAALDITLADLPSYEKNYLERETVRHLRLYGECLAALGRKPEAIARWQSALDRFPTCAEYDAIEGLIEASL